MVVILSSAGAVSHHDLTSLQDSSYRRRTNPQFDIDSKKSHAEQYTSKKDRTQSPLHCEHCPYRYDPSLTRLQHLLLDIHLTLEDPNFSFLAKALGTFIMVLILLSTLVFCIETLPELQEYTTVFLGLETFFVAVFTLEYLARFMVARRKLRFFFKLLNLIDLMAIIPLYTDLIFADDGDSSGFIRVFRVVRLARTFRLLKMSRHSAYMRVMAVALTRSSDAFSLMVFLITLVMIIFSSVMYFCERGSYDSDLGTYVRSDGKVSPFQSIPTTFYWCIVTITTVGYGDHGIYPIEGMGRIVAAIAMISGILVIALPTSILGSNFQDVYSVHKRKKMMMVGQAKPSSLVTLRASVCELRSNRISLERTLKKARLHLSRVKTKEPTDTHQVWTTVDYSILRTLRELETYFSQFEDEEEEKGTSGRDLLFDERIHNDTNTGENGENDRADDSDTNDASDEEEDGFDADGNGNGNEVDGKLVPRSEYEILNSELRNAPTYSSIPVQTSKNEHGNN